ncbi:hypothetical protein A606_11155 [Corynebacterium terpenotabidum Y-11]|uniref:Uncharacterized protein n=1 Tax=Corynebacterium terpenotabidum Y-11 TaxID=1200352 RepID=S4XJE2_9CORY|nr:hypothetical protein A606_11155 [Corynebacterium terpenotabidum Y-11]
METLGALMVEVLYFYAVYGTPGGRPGESVGESVPDCAVRDLTAGPPEMVAHQHRTEPGCAGGQ